MVIVQNHLNIRYRATLNIIVQSVDALINKCLDSKERAMNKNLGLLMNQTLETEQNWSACIQGMRR